MNKTLQYVSVDFDDTLEVFPKGTQGGVWGWDRNAKVPNWPLIHKLKSFLADNENNVLVLTTSRSVVHLQECVEFCKWVKLEVKSFKATGDSFGNKADWLRTQRVDLHLDDDVWELDACKKLEVPALHWKEWLAND